jgi:hypothetical protein
MVHHGSHIMGAAISDTTSINGAGTSGLAEALPRPPSGGAASLRV